MKTLVNFALFLFVFTVSVSASAQCATPRQKIEAAEKILNALDAPDARTLDKARCEEGRDLAFVAHKEFGDCDDDRLKARIQAARVWFMGHCPSPGGGDTNETLREALDDLGRLLLQEASALGKLFADTHSVDALRAQQFFNALGKYSQAISRQSDPKVLQGAYELFVTMAKGQGPWGKDLAQLVALVPADRRFTDAELEAVRDPELQVLLRGEDWGEKVVAYALAARGEAQRQEREAAVSAFVGGVVAAQILADLAAYPDVTISITPLKIVPDGACSPAAAGVRDAKQANTLVRNALITGLTRKKPVKTSAIFDEAQGEPPGRVRLTATLVPGKDCGGKADTQCLRLTVGIFCRGNDADIRRSCSKYGEQVSTPFANVCSAPLLGVEEVLGTLVPRALDAVALGYRAAELWVGPGRLTTPGSVVVVGGGPAQSLTSHPLPATPLERGVYVEETSSASGVDPTLAEDLQGFRDELTTVLESAFPPSNLKPTDHQLFVGWKPLAEGQVEVQFEYCRRRTGPRCDDSVPLWKFTAELKPPDGEPRRFGCSRAVGKKQEQSYCHDLALQAELQLSRFIHKHYASVLRGAALKEAPVVDHSTSRSCTGKYPDGNCRWLAIATGSLPYWLDERVSNDKLGGALAVLEIVGLATAATLYAVSIETRNDRDLDAANTSLQGARLSLSLGLALPRVLGIVLYKPGKRGTP